MIKSILSMLNKFVSDVYNKITNKDLIGFTFGMGSGSLISSKLGERKEEDAQRIGSSAFYIAIILGLVITILSLIFINPLLRLLGASSNVLPYAKDYAIYVIIGFPIMLFF